MNRQVQIVATLLVAATASTNASFGEDAPERLTLNELRAQYGDTDGRIANVQGVEVYYKDQGEGPAILMIHGSRSTLRTWDGVTPQLIDRYRVIRYDLPPQGLSGPVSDEAAGRLSPASLAAGLLDYLNVDRVTCVGVSSGGTTCMYLAATYPNRVTRLVMSNSPSDPVTTGHLKMPPEFIEAQRVARESGFESLNFWNEFLDYFNAVPARISAQKRREYYDFNRRIVEPNITALVGLVSDKDKTMAALSSVRAPALLIWGSKDPLLPPNTAAKLAGYLENTQVSVVFMPDVGHYPPVEAPYRFGKIVAAYLEAAAPAEARKDGSD